MCFFDELREGNLTGVGILFELNTRYSSPMISISTNQSHCYPSDVAIIAIYDFPGASELLEFPFATDKEINEAKSVFISGHPYTNDYEYVLPTKEPGDDEKIIKAFHEFKYQVNSFGSILNHCESGLLELELSATTGMSGSPVLLGEYPDLKIGGIYCGGPPIIGQYLLTQAIDSLISGDVKNALNISKDFPFDNRDIYNYNIRIDNVRIDCIALEKLIEDDIPDKSLGSAIHETIEIMETAI